MEEHRARFAVGQIVQHKLFDYRGIIYDVDPVFAGTEEWYEQIAKSRPPKDRPWYRVLVDGETHTTYVAERNLEEAPDEGEEVHHPLLSQFLRRTDDGQWVSQESVN